MSAEIGVWQLSLADYLIMIVPMEGYRDKPTTYRLDTVVMVVGVRHRRNQSNTANTASFHSFGFGEVR